MKEANKGQKNINRIKNTRMNFRYLVWTHFKHDSIARVDYLLRQKQIQKSKSMSGQ